MHGKKGDKFVNEENTYMKFRTKFLAAIFFFLPTVVLVQAQTKEIILPRWGIKTNILYDATATINLGAEVRTGEQTSVELAVNYNNWEFKGDRKWKHYLIQPEFRWWPGKTFDGHFFGAHAHWALYNVGNLPKPPFSTWMNTHRYEGWLAGAGISYGYRWNFDHRWALEATVGVGYAYLDYDEFNCGRCGELLASKTTNYFGPTKAGVSLIFGFGGGEVEQTPVLVAPPAPVVQTQPVYEPVLRAAFVTPEVEAVKARSESGSAYLDFVVGRSEILTNFRNNSVELQKIYSTLETVRNNPDATITGMSIVGHASPEGTYSSNMQLSERRTEALKNHVHSIFGLDGVLIVARGEGEDWAGLDSLVAASNLLEKYSALEIIRGSDHPDVRETRLRALDGGSVYRQIFADFYPQLRRSDYRISYTVTPFSVEKGKEVFRSRPGNLSLNEMFLIADTYREGSAEFAEVFEVAAQIFPDSDVANLNAAASALVRNDTAAAARYLDRVKNRGEEWNNNMGMLAWLRGEKLKALEHFAAAGSQGAGNVAELDKHMKSVTQN